MSPRIILFLAALCPAVTGLGAPAAESGPRVWLEDAVDASFAEDYRSAILSYERVLKVDPKSEAARKGLKRAQRQRALQIKRQREAEKAGLFAVEDYLADGRLIEADDRLKEIEGRIPGHPDVAKLTRKVRERAEGAPKKSPPGSADAHYAQGVLSYLDGDWFKAVDSWERVLKFAPERVDVQARIERARQNLARQERLDRIEVLLEVGDAYMKQRLFGEARKVYEKLLAQDPGNDRARRGIAEAKRAAADQAHQERAEEVQRVMAKAMGAYTAGREQEAVRLFRRVLDMEPSNTLARDYLIRIQTKDPTLKLTPPAAGGADGNLERAQRLAEEGRFVEAVQAVERYRVSNPEDPRGDRVLEDIRALQADRAEAAYREGLTLYAQGRVSDARARWEQALKMYPEFSKARQALTRTLREEDAR